MEERTYRPGIAHEGIAGEFKESVLAEDLIRGWPYIAFRPETLIGSYRGGCSDIGDSSRLGPGESIDLRVQWDGSVYLRLGKPPSGPLHIKGSFRDYRRPGAEGPRERDAVIDISLEAWVIDGRDPGLLDPPEVVDAALASAEFSAWPGDAKHRQCE